MAPGQVYPKKKQNRVNRYKENGPPPPTPLAVSFPFAAPYQFPLPCLLVPIVFAQGLIAEDYSLDTIKSIMDASMGNPPLPPQTILSANELTGELIASGACRICR